MSWIKKIWGGKTDDEHSPTTDRSADEAIAESEADEVLPEENRSLIAQMISQHGLTMNMDLSKVALPTFILEPRTLLEKLSDTVTHPDIFASIAKGATAEERMVRLVRWYMSAYHRRPKGVKKPFNPVLGEVFEATYTAEGAEGADPVKFVAEQVSHHPPISAFFARTRSGSIVMQGTFAPKSRFLGNSAASIGEGGFSIYLPEHDELYVCTWPTVYVRGIIFGRLLMELGGPVMIRCPSTNIHADIEFVVKGYFTGTHNAVTGSIFAGNPKNTKERVVLYTLDGSWVEKMNIKGSKDSAAETLFDFKSTPMAECVVDESSPLSSDPYNSRVHWKEALDAIRRGDMGDATKHKVAVEEHQRKVRAERAESGEAFQPRLFKVVKELEDYAYVGHDAIAIPTPPTAM